MQFVIDGSNRTAENCAEYVEYFNRDRHPYETLSLLVPTNNVVWTERSTAWTTLFIIMIVLLAIFYATVGIVSVILLVRRDSLRLKTRTFFAVYLSMAILGFSRATLFVLDPFGILGFISGWFPGWIVISRFLAAVGFPSLVASCTLIVATLFKLVNAKQEKQWYEKWSYVLPPLAIPYALALIAEAMGHIGTYSAVFSGIVCETFFVFWGLFICISFLCAGTRLLKTLKNNHRKVTIVSQDRDFTDHRPSNTSANQFKMHDRKTKRIARKIVVITYGTATAGVLYSIASAGGVVMVLLLTFMDCMGFVNMTNSALWLGVQFANFVTEIFFAGFILYSVTDISLLLSFFKLALHCRCCVLRGSSSDTSSSTQQESMQDIPEVEEGGARADGGTLRLENNCTDTAMQGSDQLENRYTIKTKNNSDSSMESVEEEMKTPLRPHPGRKLSSQSHDIRAGVEPAGSRPSLPLHLETLGWSKHSMPTDLEDNISKVLSIPETPSQFHPYTLWTPKPQKPLKRTRGSEPSMVIPNRNSPLGDPLLRHCNSDTPTKRNQRQVTNEPLKMSPLTTEQSYGTLALRHTPTPPPLSLTQHTQQKNPAPPKRFERQATT